MRLHEADVPFILLTNGGGQLEKDKADSLRKLLDLPFLSPEQVVLSHTPLRPVCAQFHNKKVLILGSREYVEVARHYGVIIIMSQITIVMTITVADIFLSLLLCHGH
jgi:ribonucleotide monophosphatase NagD (HAD superfamily)